MMVHSEMSRERFLILFSFGDFSLKFKNLDVISFVLRKNLYEKNYVCESIYETIFK